MSKTVGILGGTFSPIHNGHINIAKAAIKSQNLDEVWLMVAGIMPHKEEDPYVSRFHRYEMCRLATENEDRLKLCDMELYDTKKSYTYETMKKLHEKYPEDKFYFIMGEDSLDAFDSWKNPEIISKYCDILVAARIDCDYQHIDDRISELKARYFGDFIKIDADFVPISSSQIRENTSKEYLNGKVYEYIITHRLYQAPDKDYDIDAIMSDIKEHISPRRYIHSLGVAAISAALADTYLFPSKTAYAAGLMHDCGKYMKGEEFLKYCDEHDIEVTKVQRISPDLLHGAVGAYIAKTKYGVEDQEILDAITYHTTGRANMSLLEKIVFVADYIEPGRRRSKELNRIRIMSYKDIDKAIIMILEETFAFLKQKNAVVDDTAKEAYKFYTGEEYEDY